VTFSIVRVGLAAALFYAAILWPVLATARRRRAIGAHGSQKRPRSSPSPVSVVAPGALIALGLTVLATAGTQ
jgi:hypothetical protein